MPSTPLNTFFHIFKIVFFVVVTCTRHKEISLLRTFVQISLPKKQFKKKMETKKAKSVTYNLNLTHTAQFEALGWGK